MYELTRAFATQKSCSFYSENGKAFSEYGNKLDSLCHAPPGKFRISELQKCYFGRHFVLIVDSVIAV